MLCAKMDGEPDLSEEIKRELELIGDDDQLLQEDETAEDEDITAADDEDIPVQDFTLPYLERVQSRTGAFEKCLDECDELLKTLGTKEANKSPDDGFLKLAQENGVEDVESFKSMITAEADELEQEEENLKSARNDPVCAEKVGLSEGSENDNQMVNNNNSECKEGATEKKVKENGEHALEDNPELVQEETAEAPWEDMIGEYEQWTEKWLMKKTQRKMIEEDKKRNEVEKLAVVEKQRTMKLKEIEIEQEQESRHQMENLEKLNREMEQEEQKIKESLEIYQAEIDKLAQDIAEEQKNLEKTQQEQNQQNKDKIQRSAVKIQAVWRGFRARKVHGDALKERLVNLKREREAVMLKEIEDGRKRIERQKEEKVRMEQERIEKEKREKEELERMKREDQEREEREKKEREETEKQEMLRLEEEKRARKEFERKEKEEKDKLERERKEKEETERKEKKRKEIEDRERKEREEQERLEKEKQDMEEIERKKREEQERKEKEDKDRKEKAEKERLEQERKKEEMRQKEEKRKKEEQKRKAEEEKKRQEEMRRKEEEAKRKERERKLQLMMTLPKELESMRLEWMKSCSPWSKSKQELKRRKPTSAKKQLRRPLSAKKLPLLKDEIILSAGQESSLQQITTVELKDLPGFSTSPLGGCKSLKHLSINNCHLVSLEGFEQHGAIQYLDLKNNDLEALCLTDASALLWLDVSHNNLSSIHGLEGCQNIRHLNLSHNRITRIACTEWLTSVHTLDLSNNQLITTKGLGLMSTVQDLNLSSNHLANVEDIETLSLLTCLDASSNNLLQIPEFGNHVLVRHLNLRDNSLSSVDGLTTAWLPLLRTLILAHNGFTELSSLGHLVSLMKLDISHNQLIDLESISPGIKDCRQLSELLLEENPITEENDYRLLLRNEVPTLKEVDGVSVAKNTDANNAELLTGFEVMCNCQNEIRNKLKFAYIDALKKDIALGNELLQLHLMYFDEDLRLAEEQRFAHEFGSISSHLETTLKIDFEDVVKKSKKCKKMTSNTVTVASAESLMQSASAKSKNKFEEALNKVAPKPPSVPKTQPSRNLKSATSSPAKSSYSNVVKSDNENLDGHIENQSDLTSRVQGRMSGTQGQTGAPGSVSASTVQKILQNEQQSSVLQERAATVIQAYWRGHSVRQEIEKLTKRCLAATVIQAAYRGQQFRGNLTQHLWPGVDIAVLSDAAVIIQALWRGYILRKRLQQALDYARIESGEGLEDDEFPEIDLDDFNFDEDGLNKDWIPPDTPQIPSSHAVLKSQSNHGNGRSFVAGTNTVQPHVSSKVQLFQQVPHAPTAPVYAWENSSARHNPQEVSPNGKPPLPPLSRLSSVTSEVSLPVGWAETTRTANSKRGDKLAEEWGFKDSKTAELMMARAKKLKYNAQRKQKFSQLDPKQKLALYKKLEETSRVKPIQLPPKKSVPRKEYFQARADELRAEEMKKEREKHQKVFRTYEWVSTQVGGYELPTARNVSLQGATNLPHIDPAVINRGRAQLTASPSLELQSVHSESHADLASYRRHSSASDNGSKLSFPAIKTSSAPHSHIKERMSFRNAPVEKSIGWGGGKKHAKRK